MKYLFNNPWWDILVDLVMCVLQQEYKQNMKARNVFKTKKNHRVELMSKPHDGWIFCWRFKSIPSIRREENATFFSRVALRKKSNIQFSRGITTAVMSFSWTLKFSILDGASRLAVVVTAETRSKKPKKRRKRGKMASFIRTWVLGCSLIRKWPIFLSCSGSRSLLLQTPERRRDFLLVIRKSWTFATTPLYCV